MMSVMPRLVSLLTGSVLLVSAAAALAQPVSKPRAQAPAATASQPSPARGVIKAVTDTRLVLDTKAPGSGPDTLLLDDKTVVQRLGKALTVKDLKIGAPVTVSYVMRDGHPVATRVWVRFANAGGRTPSPAAKASGMAAKPAR